MTRVPIWRDGSTVDRFGKYSCKGCLPNTVESEEYVSVMKSLSFAGICEDFLHKVLTDDIGEFFWAIGLVEGHSIKYKGQNTKEK